MIIVFMPSFKSFLSNYPKTLKNMKTTFLIGIMSVVLIFSACTKENNPSQLQPHDQNKMMAIMHLMMNQMDTMQKTKDPEIDFLRMMVIHHQGAINMSNLELQEGKDDSLKRTAQKIINEQQEEILQFNIYLAANTVNNSEPAFGMEQMDNMMKMGDLSDVQFITGDIDNDFASLMIPHHQAAIDNAQAYLTYGNDTQAKTWAQKIIDTQKMEIIELSSWLIANKR